MGCSFSWRSAPNTPRWLGLVAHPLRHRRLPGPRSANKPGSVSYVLVQTLGSGFDNPLVGLPEPITVFQT